MLVNSPFYYLYIQYYKKCMKQLLFAVSEDSLHHLPHWFWLTQCHIRLETCLNNFTWTFFLGGVASWIIDRKKLQSDKSDLGVCNNKDYNRAACACVFTAWANWHSAGVLSQALSLSWQKWPTAMACKNDKARQGTFRIYGADAAQIINCSLKRTYSWTTNHFIFVT